MELIIDNRETKIKNILNGDNIKYENLDIADIHVKNNGSTVLLIERKTNSDMQSSLIDGRYKEQKNRMLSTGIPILYILEGDSFLHTINPSPIEKAQQTIELDLCFSNKTQFIRTKNVEDTSHFLLLCMAYFGKIPNTQPVESLDEDFLCKKRTKCVTEENILKIMLCQIPGVSIKTANAISLYYKASPFGFFSKLTNHANMIDTIAEITTGSKKIGKTLANKIVHILLHNADYS